MSNYVQNAVTPRDIDPFLNRFYTIQGGNSNFTIPLNTIKNDQYIRLQSLNDSYSTISSQTYALNMRVGGAGGGVGISFIPKIIEANGLQNSNKYASMKFQYSVLNALSTPTDRFTDILGHHTVNLSVTTTGNTCAFIYSDNINSGKFLCRTSTGLITDSDSGVTVELNKIYNLEIVNSVDGNAIYFYINNLLVAEHTTNLTDLTLENMVVRRNKNVGTGAKALNLYSMTLKTGQDIR